MTVSCLNGYFKKSRVLNLSDTIKVRVIKLFLPVDGDTVQYEQRDWMFRFAVQKVAGVVLSEK